MCDTLDALSLMGSRARDEKAPDEYTFYLEGDLGQMGNQRYFLQQRGFSLKQNNVYPCLRACDVKKAMELIWSHRVDGWWHYMKKYVEFGICTEDEFSTRLNAQCDQERKEWEEKKKRGR